MSLAKLLKQRKSVRAFTNQPVSEEQIRAILEMARHTPSSENIQPWQVAVVRGATLRKLTETMLARFSSGDIGAMEYESEPESYPELYMQRRRDCGRALYAALDIKREDKARRMEQWAANFRAFDAPAILLLFLDPALKISSYIDTGMFMQSLMLAAEELGLATCAQASLARYAEPVKQHLAYPQELILVGGIALGYEDKEAPVNNYRTSREPVDSFTRFFN